MLELCNYYYDHIIYVVYLWVQLKQVMKKRVTDIPSQSLVVPSSTGTMLFGKNFRLRIRCVALFVIWSPSKGPSVRANKCCRNLRAREIHDDGRWRHGFIPHIQQQENRQSPNADNCYRPSFSLSMQDPNKVHGRQVKDEPTGTSLGCRLTMRLSHWSTLSSLEDHLNVWRVPPGRCM